MLLSWESTRRRGPALRSDTAPRACLLTCPRGGLGFLAAEQFQATELCPRRDMERAMQYAIKVAKGGAAADLLSLSAPEALQRMEDAEARGMAVTCSNAEGKSVSKDELQHAAGQDPALRSSPSAWRRTAM